MLSARIGKGLAGPMWKDWLALLEEKAVLLGSPSVGAGSCEF